MNQNNQLKESTKSIFTITISRLHHKHDIQIQTPGNCWLQWPICHQLPSPRTLSHDCLKHSFLTGKSLSTFFISERLSALAAEETLDLDIKSTMRPEASPLLNWGGSPFSHTRTPPFKCCYAGCMHEYVVFAAFAVNHLSCCNLEVVPRPLFLCWRSEFQSSLFQSMSHDPQVLSLVHTRHISGPTVWSAQEVIIL
jgi:hypothetical protein